MFYAQKIGNAKWKKVSRAVMQRNLRRFHSSESATLKTLELIKCNTIVSFGDCHYSAANRMYDLEQDPI